MRTTPVWEIPFPEPEEHTRTWELWQAQAERLEELLSGTGWMLEDAIALNSAVATNLAPPASSWGGVIKAAGWVQVSFRCQLLAPLTPGSDGNFADTDIATVAPEFIEAALTYGVAFTRPGVGQAFGRIANGIITATHGIPGVTIPAGTVQVDTVYRAES